MEQFVLGIFQEQLSKFIVGFRKEQVNANLLNGKGEIHNVELNCSFLNEEISKSSAFFQLESVHISKLSFHVTSWTNIRKAPIAVDIEHVTAYAMEPLHYLDSTKRSDLRQITEGELIEMIKEGLWKPRGSYNLFDRIVDNLTVEIGSINIYFRTCGKFKTRREGPWTPPELGVTLAGLRFVSVNEFGQESSPEEVWKHNHRAKSSLFIYKRLEMGYQVKIRPSESDERIPLMTGRDNKMVVQLAMERRIRDGELIAVQIDTTVPKIEVDLPSRVVPMLAHLAAGLTYCFAKDRKFSDPLKPKSSKHSESNDSPGIEITNSELEVDGISDGEEKAGVLADVDVGALSSDDEEEDGGSSVEPDKTTTSPASGPAYLNKPMIMLPNGVVLHDQFCLSVSVLHVTVRGMYGEAPDGHVQIVAKGCMAEMIWPKVTKEKGGYVQASVSFLSIQERFAKRMRTILVGGVEYDNKTPKGQSPKALSEVGRDETFPLFEERSIRADPTGLRHTFPAQAFGLKTTVDFVKRPYSTNDEMMVIHELGIDRIVISLDSDCWARALQFALNDSSGGLDPRWHSGDWSNILTKDMMLNASVPLNLSDHLQPTKQIFLDENQFISSDLLNATVRFTNMDIRIPAAISKTINSCDVRAVMDEMMLVVSSALPRTLTSWEIGAFENGKRVAGENVEFPNDKSDIALELEKSEDPSNVQRGVKLSKVMSTFRAQLTCRNFSVRLVPVVSVFSFSESRQLLGPCEFTSILCFEGEPPENTDSALSRTVLFASVVAHKMDVNLDIDLLASALNTVSYHQDVATRTADTLVDILQRAALLAPRSEETEVENIDSPVKRSLTGHQALIRKQISRSRESSGFSVSVQIELAEMAVSVWRQSVPFDTTHMLERADGKPHNTMRSDVFCPLLKVVVLRTARMEVGIEATLLVESRRMITKVCLGQVSLDLCDFVALKKVESAWCKSSVSTSEVDIASKYRDESSLTRIFSLGLNEPQEGWQDQRPGLLMRCEHSLMDTKSLSLSTQITGATMVLQIDAMTTTIILLLEALVPHISLHRRKNGASGEDNVKADSLRGLLGLVSVGVAAFARKVESARLSLLSDRSVLNRMKRIYASLTQAVDYMLPTNLAAGMFRMSLRHFQLRMPARSEEEEVPVWVLVDVKRLQFLLSNFTRDSWKSPMLSTVCSKDTLWATDVSVEKGLQHSLRMSYAVACDLPANDSASSSSILSGDLKCVYSKAQTSVSMPGGVILENLHCCERVVTILIELSRRIFHNASVLRKILFSICGILNVDKGTVSEALCESSYPVPYSVEMQKALGTVFSSLQLARETISKTVVSTKSILVQTNKMLEDNREYMDQMKITLFSAEKERFGALALLSSSTMGWLQVGSAHRTGLRGQLASSMWPVWAAVRRGFLVLFASPGMCEPLEFIPLKGTSIREIVGGRKRDVKRAFAIVHEAGAVHFALSQSDTDHYRWTTQLISLTQQLKPDAYTDPTDGVFLGDDNSMQDQGGEKRSSSLGKPLGRSVSRVVKVAKATGQAVADRRRRKNGELGLDGDSTHGTASSTTDDTAIQESGTGFSDKVRSRIDTDESTPTALPAAGRRQRFRNRFANVSANVGQVTKSKLGSALQVAKDKGKSLSDHRRRDQPESHDPSEPSPALGESDTIGWECASCTAFNGQSVAQCQVCEASKLPESSDESNLRCKSCTYVNDEIATSCEMCGNPLPDYKRASTQLSTDEVVDEESIEGSEEGDDARVGSEGKRGLKDRFGAAVRTARRSKDVDVDAQSGSRFSLRRRNVLNRTDGQPGSMGFSKLRGVAIGPILELPLHPLGGEKPVVPLKKLDGVWVVRVKPLRIKASTKIEKTSETELSILPLTTDPENEGVSMLPEKEDAFSTNNANEGISPLLGHRDDEEVLKAPISDVEHETNFPAKTCFTLQVFKVSDKNELLSATATKTFSGIVELHSVLSSTLLQHACELQPETNEEVRDSNPSLDLGLSTLETVRVTGRLLGGALDLGSQRSYDDWIGYLCNLVEEFINAMLECALPIDALVILTEFLCLTNVSTQTITGEKLDSVASDDTTINSPGLLPDSVNTLFHSSLQLLTSSERTLQSIDHGIHEAVLNDVCFAATPPAPRETSIHYPVFEASGPSRHFQEAMRQALLKVMADRDDAHCRMVSAEVLYVHEIEQQRKHVTQLSKQLEILKNSRSIQSQSSRRISDKNTQDATLKKQMQQNSDEELISLCQQLGKEISARTEAGLEVVRLKEQRKLEMEIEASEKQALNDELVEAKRLLEEMRKKPNP